MKFLVNMRISQKIMALVAGLVVGFIAIGAAYFVQVNLQAEQSRKNAQLSAMQNTLMNLAMTGAGLAAQDANLEKAKDDIQVLVASLQSKEIKGVQTDTITQVLEEYFSAHSEYTSLQGALAEKQQSVIAAFAVLHESLPSQALNLALLQASEASYLAEPDAQRYANVLDSLNRLKDAARADEQTAKGEAALNDLEKYSREFEALAYSIKDLESLVAQKSELHNALNADVSALAMQVEKDVNAARTEAEQQHQTMTAVFIVMVSIIVTATAVGVYFLYKGIVFPMTHMQSVIRRINRGKLKARVKMIGNDEMGDLGNAFNQLLDDRIKNLEDQALENEHLNNSIISLIRAVGTIARKDLTIKVPVSADITGTVSDAINLLTSETAKTLAQVRAISGDVDQVADVLQEQSETVVRVAEDERKQVIATAKALEVSARAMNDIASKAGDANKLAKGAIANTQQARESVEQAVESILTIRETISETEKRIKRLGDRSQEISGIVSLINTIAERTHILALNASMHAASAGEAGKGFAVVADEVQRLAENAREATADISSMVNNIRVETSDTVNIMNKLIAEVALGTKTAEVAGRRMNETDQATNELVALVQVMAQSAVQQAEVTNRVRDRAMIIRNFTEKTGSQLIQQKTYTDSLKGQSALLVEQVSLFKLPENVLAQYTPTKPEQVVISKAM
ncbi:methyl-accepting chemotaxis protein [Marinagarivorans algicola]|uniref:methyl-accepting chemotaxis protein n=1 Tax=Marinagarivorans algicola TaxID=1513270 RepID=UPI0006B41F50|nr:methyl-accepting chemotaxis protein [Marinagarivorans algicola]